MPAQEHPVGADHERDQHGARRTTARRRLGAADEHDGEHDQDAGERRDARGVARTGTTWRSSSADRVLPGRAVAAESSLMQVVSSDVDDHHADGEDRGPAVLRARAAARRAATVRSSCRWCRTRPRSTRSGRAQPRLVGRPALGRVGPGRRGRQRRPVAVHQEGQQREQRRSTAAAQARVTVRGRSSTRRQYAGTAAARPAAGAVADALTVTRRRIACACRTTASRAG